METDMPEQMRKTKERSPNFPFIPLDEAVTRAREFYDKEKRGVAPFEVAVRHWGYSPSSSGAKQTVAALKQYGLMEDEGSGRQRGVRLSDLALRILLDPRSGPEREEYKRQAALMPTVAREVYEKWENSMPSDATLSHYLILERGFNAPTAAKAV